MYVGYLWTSSAWRASVCPIHRTPCTNTSDAPAISGASAGLNDIATTTGPVRASGCGADLRSGEHEKRREHLRVARIAEEVADAAATTPPSRVREAPTAQAQPPQRRVVTAQAGCEPKRWTRGGGGGIQVRYVKVAPRLSATSRPCAAACCPNRNLELESLAPENEHRSSATGDVLTGSVPHRIGSRPASPRRSRNTNQCASHERPISGEIPNDPDVTPRQKTTRNERQADKPPRCGMATTKGATRPARAMVACG